MCNVKYFRYLRNKTETNVKIRLTSLVFLGSWKVFKYPTKAANITLPTLSQARDQPGNIKPPVCTELSEHRSRLDCTVGYWWSGLKFENNCVPPQDVNSHNLGFVYLEASVNVYSTEEYVSRMLILQRRSVRCFQCIMTRRVMIH